MSPPALAAALTVALFLGMVVCLELGYRLGGRDAKLAPKAHEGIGAIEAAIFALLGLLLGFAFAGAMSRLDSNRQLIVREANAIGTAYLRLDIVPVSSQPELRRLFREYLEARLRVYENVSDRGLTDERIAQGDYCSSESGRKPLLPAKLIALTTPRGSCFPP